MRPTVDLAASWWDLVDAFAGETIHGSGLRPGDSERLRDPDVFAEWVDWLGRMERSDEELPEGRVPSSYRWVLDDGRVVGAIAIRHALTPSLLAEGGHIGYAVGPADRGRGVASAALSLALDHAARRGIDPALVTCEGNNVGLRSDHRAGDPGARWLLRGRARRHPALLGAHRWGDCRWRVRG